MKIPQFALEKIFEKNLLMLIPFYIFSHEKRFKEHERDEEKLYELQKEYAFIKDRLEYLMNQGVISEFTGRTIIVLDLCSNIFTIQKPPGHSAA